MAVLSSHVVKASETSNAMQDGQVILCDLCEHFSDTRNNVHSDGQASAQLEFLSCISIIET